ncbi:RNA-directed DNA polymerase, eukaryota [Tanacetum coccineum]
MEDRWSWSLSSSGEFSVSSVRRLIDDKTLPDATQKTRWVRLVPIKINVHAWKVKSNSLPTRFNISRRGILIDSLKCGTCDMGVETVNHLFFSCTLVRNLVDLIVRWWNVTRVDIDSYSDWELWIQNLRLPIKNKRMLEELRAAKVKKDLAIKKCEEMKFVMIDTSNLPSHKRAFIERQQAEIMKKYEDDGADDYVLVHSGGVHGGHYYAYIRLTLSNNWFKFDDERVTIEDFKRAVKEQYGVPEGTKIHDKLGLIECQCLWMFEERHNHTYRPDKLLTTATYERKLGSSPAKTRSKQDILVLVKLYDPEKKKPKYVKDINLYPILMIEEEILE